MSTTRPQPPRAEGGLDGEARGEMPHRASMEATGSDGVERRLAGKDSAQHLLVAALERALQGPGARNALRPRLRTMSPFRVERERGAQTRPCRRATCRDSPVTATVLSPQYVAVIGTSESSTK